MDAINTYHRIFPSDKPYLVVDKQKGVLGIYKNGQLLKQERIFRGQHTGDADIPLPINGYGIRTKRGNNMSGAGIFNIRSVAMEVGHRDPRTLKELNHPDGTKGYYTQEPIFRLKRQDGSNSNMAIHALASEKRVELFNSDPNAKKVTAGCISGRPGMCQDLQDIYNIANKQRLYVLPEEQGNRFILSPKDSVLRYSVSPENIQAYRLRGGFDNQTTKKEVDRELRERILKKQQKKINFLDLFNIIP